jgi:hypothetical protein
MPSPPSNQQTETTKTTKTTKQVDVARNVVERLAAAHAGIPRLSYLAADCRRMPQLADCSFGGVLDKGAAGWRGDGGRMGALWKARCSSA